MSAEGHHQAASDHAKEADAHQQKYDPAATDTAPVAGGDAVTEGGGGGGGISMMTYNPTEEHLRHAKQHRKHAADHEAAAEALEAFEEQQCGRFPKESRVACPLMGNVVSVEDLEATTAGGHGQGSGKHGIRIRFADDVDRDAVIAHMRCHIAFARTRGREGMGHCPLYVEGVSVAEDSKQASSGIHGVKGHSSAKGGPGGAGEAHGPGRSSMELHVEPGSEAHTVDLLVEDEALVKELRRRAKAHMPGAQ